MVTFDVTAHPLLSEDAKALRGDPAAPSSDFLAHVAAAVIALGFDELDAVPVGQEARADLAVVYQVNHQVAFAEEGFFLSSKKAGPLTRDFRDYQLVSPERAA